MPPDQLCYSCYDGTTHIRIEGPNAKNAAKLVLMRETKAHQNTHHVSCTYTKQYCRWRNEVVETYIITCTPTEAYRQKLDAEAERYRQRYQGEEDTYHDNYVNWRKKNDRRPKLPRKKKRYGGKPEREPLELLEEALCRPRSRKQRGWGDIYLPTRHRRCTRDDLKNWKRNRLHHWRDSAVSFRTLQCT